MRWNEPIWDELVLEVSNDAGTNHLLVQAIKSLHYHSGLPAEECTQLVCRHYTLLSDPVHCAGLGIRVHDDDDFHAEGPLGLALRSYYRLVLKGQEDEDAYRQWRASLRAG